MNKNYLRKIISSSMWIICGFIFLPLKFFKLVQLHYNPSEFKNIDKPVILASNHRHALDPLTIGVAAFPFFTHYFLPLTPYAAPLHRLKRFGQQVAKRFGLLQFIYFIFNVSYIPEEVSFSEKLSPLVCAIKDGQSVLIFPEGRIYNDLETHPFKKGVAELHNQTGALIVPCAIYYYKKKYFYRAIVSFGAPMKVSKQLYEKGGLEEVAESIRKEVDDLYRKIIQSVT